MDSMKNDSTHYVSDQIAEGPRTPRLPDECCENGKLGQLHNCKKNMATSPIIQNGWISIHDRMPEQGRWIAVALTDGQVLADYRGSLPFSKYVAYWQYLPEAPNVQSPCAATRETRGTPPLMSISSEELAAIAQNPGCEPVAPGASAPSPFMAEEIRRAIYRLWTQSRKNGGGNGNFGTAHWQTFVREEIQKRLDAAATPAGTQPAQEGK